MTFLEAMMNLKEGKKVRACSWDPEIWIAHNCSRGYPDILDDCVFGEWELFDDQPPLPRRITIDSDKDILFTSTSIFSTKGRSHHLVIDSYAKVMIQNLYDWIDQQIAKEEQ